jgi:hypothetical protein
MPRIIQLTSLTTFGLSSLVREGTCHAKAHAHPVREPRRRRAVAGGPDEDPSGGFDHGVCSFGGLGEQMERAMGESLSKPFDLALGRKTYASDDRRAPDARDGSRYCGAQP